MDGRDGGCGLLLTGVFTKTVRDHWKGTTITVVALAVYLLYAVWVFRTLDLSIYTGMPEAARAIAGIPAEADAGSLAIGFFYESFGAFALAGLAVAMGSATIAREENRGTIGLLLANPVSRTHALVSKTASMVVLIGLATIGMWSASHLVPRALDVDITGLDVGAIAVHVYANALFYGFLAVAIGSYTGNRGAAAGVAAGAMVLSYFAVGLFPLAEGVEDVAKVFPWYYFDRSDPLVNGIDAADLAVLGAGIAILAIIAAVGVNRRDLKSQSVSGSLLDRLRESRMTRRGAEWLAGSARTSSIWAKTISEHRAVLTIAGAAILVMGVALGPMFNLMPEGVMDLGEQVPEAALAAVGGGDMSTPEGWYQIETFSLMAPIAVMVVTIMVGARALAGEEERRTMGLLLANPITRSRVVVEKAVAMSVCASAVGAATFAGVALGSLIGGLGLSTSHVAAASLLVTLLGLAFGALALALGAATGRVRVATFGTVGVALATYMLNAVAPLSDTAAAFAKASPFYYHVSSEPLVTGMPWGHGAVLAGVSAGLVALSAVLFQRRDIRQGD